MNKFSMTWLKAILFVLFIGIVLIVFAALLYAPVYRNNHPASSAPEIPAVVYLSDSDVSETDLSESDMSDTDVMDDADLA